MRRLILMLFAVGIAYAVPPSVEAERNTLAAQSPWATEYGPARVPVGYIAFCKAWPEECIEPRVRPTEPRQIEIDADRWTLIRHINVFVNQKVQPQTDLEQYGEKELWAYPDSVTSAGDCEDYALLKMRFLLELGFPRESLRLTIVLDEGGNGHAVLTVVTDKGDLILDNRRDQVLMWNETKYTFLTRLSGVSPTEWVALAREKVYAPTTGQ